MQGHTEVYLYLYKYRLQKTQLIYLMSIHRATLRGKPSGSLEHTVIYPPNGVIPFHGFAMFCAPFCYVYDDPVQLYLGKSKIDIHSIPSYKKQLYKKR